MHNFNNNTDNNDEWLTPPAVLGAAGVFDLDPCAPSDAVRPWDTAKRHYTKDNDGLALPWVGRVWCNPPYGKDTFVWLKKLAAHGDGVALIFARTETRGFHSEVWKKADGIFFFKGRLSFHHVTGKVGGPANAPSCLVAYGESNARVLASYRLPGVYVPLRGVPR